MALGELTYSNLGADIPPAWHYCGVLRGLFLSEKISKKMNLTDTREQTSRLSA
jgi:hypothetical protein